MAKYYARLSERHKLQIDEISDMRVKRNQLILNKSDTIWTQWFVENRHMHLEFNKVNISWWILRWSRDAYPGSTETLSTEFLQAN